MEELGPQPRFSQLASTEPRKPLPFPLGRPHSGGPVGQGQHNSAYAGQIHRLGRCGRNRQGTPVLRETKSLVLSPSPSGPNTFTKFIRFLGCMDTLVREREAPRGTPQRPPGGPGGPALWIWHFLQVTSFHSYKNTGSRRMPISEMRI